MTHFEVFQKRGDGNDYDWEHVSIVDSAGRGGKHQLSYEYHLNLLRYQ